MTGPYDLITMGRLGVDLYPLQTGVGLGDAETFGRFLGGSAANVAVAAARLGRRTALISRTGDDPFGGFLHRALRDFGVDDRWVTPVAAYPTPLTFCEIHPPDHFPLYFYRRPKAPDLEIHAHELDLDAVRAARVFWMTGTGLSEEPSRGATLAALAARSRKAVTVFDLDWRPVFWAAAGGATAARPHYAAALAHATVAVGNAEECEVATGEREPHAAARALLAAGVELAVVKQGPEGVLAVHRDGTAVRVPPVEVEVVNGLGAGDAFGGALCHGLLAGWDLPRTVRYANAAGAIVASRLACSSAMPGRDEVAEVLGGGGTVGGGGVGDGPGSGRPGGGPATCGLAMPGASAGASSASAGASDEAGPRPGPASGPGSGRAAGLGVVRSDGPKADCPEAGPGARPGNGTAGGGPVAGSRLSGGGA
ncbi:5-dehydro-2-deoxygluconokinase [Streptomyces sp. SCA3-4]|uniref:5-dehydro-2-deoxygluconokinase n=1 Tax=Streptomyces sichuanensis TaxID=2871810 RepID=UPI001CE32C05|nr:5-dehydro-2-deoxygluconokinase [Streptomyces sichuanensis]MCA6094370.1 5-dehydro-2-deoxygluconokinase [Streptomyces sichuanensis]